MTSLAVAALSVLASLPGRTLVPATWASAAPAASGMPEAAGAPPAAPNRPLAVIGERRAITQDDLRRAARASGDTLTPESARRFLDLLIDREVLAERASRERWTWTAAESAAFAALRDRLAMAALLDSLLESASRLDPALDRQETGVRVRDSVVAALGMTCDEPLLQRLAAAWGALPRPTSDSTAAAQVRTLAENPRVAAGDSSAVVARSAAGELRVSELLEGWTKLSPAYRMRIETASQIRDLAANALFERVLREKAHAAGLERRPDIALELDRARDEIAIARLLEREVFAAIRPDPRKLERWYREHEEEWKRPLRVRVLRISTATRAEADRMALRLRSTAEAETLRSLARRARLPWEAEWTAEEAEFERAIAAGAGAVLGPTDRGGEWWVTRVLEVVPGGAPPFDAVRSRVERIWTAHESERLTRELCARWKRSIPVRVDPGALERFLGSARAAD